MVTTAPYNAAILDHLAGPLEHVTTARITNAAGVALGTLALEGGTVTFDHEWAPHVQAQLTAVYDGTIAPDPRAAHRLVIDAGYVRPDGVRDVQMLANLAVQDVTRDVGTAMWRITAHSDEALVQQSAQWVLADLVTTYGSHAAALQDLITRALEPFVPSFATTLTGTSDLMTGYRVAIGDAWWPHIESIRDAASARVYCDGARVWHIEPDPLDTFYVDGDILAAGVGGTLTAASIATTRDEWANTVIVEHEWRDGAGVYQRTARTATVTTGDYAVGTVGYRAQSLKRTTPTTLTACDAEAAAILRRAKLRGRTYTATARARYWLRPHHVSILLRLEDPGLGMYHEVRVTRVTFDLDGSGLMSIGGRSSDLEIVTD